MIQSKIFKLRYINKKKISKFVLIVPISNFVDRDTFIEPDLLIRNNYYTYPEVKNYFFERLKVEQLPFHYYVEQIKNDWDILLGCPTDSTSKWLDDCIENYYIPSSFRNATIICVQDNLSFQIPDPRMYKVMGQRLLEPYCYNNFSANVNNSVFWFHEVFNYKAFDSDTEKFGLDIKYRNKVERERYFDRTTFNLEVFSVF